MHEAMALYQTRYRLKPIGPHRRMTDELFAAVRATCPACAGRGLLDTVGGRSWQVCSTCRGFGSYFTKPTDEIEALRSRVLAEYPDAAADPFRTSSRGRSPSAAPSRKWSISLGWAHASRTRPPFDGFPYLVIRVVPTLYHITLLPAAATERDLEGIARAQWRANRLNVCLVMGPDRALYINADGHDRLRSTPSRGGILITARLRTPTHWVDTTELEARQRRLASFIDQHSPKSGNMLGDFSVPVADHPELVGHRGRPRTSGTPRIVRG